jgi:hypothetical protein
MVIAAEKPSAGRGLITSTRSQLSPKSASSRSATRSAAVSMSWNRPSRTTPVIVSATAA